MAQGNFDKKVQELQRKYVEVETEKDEAVAEVMNGGLGLMKAVDLAMDRTGKAEEANEEL